MSDHGCDGGWVRVQPAYAQGQANLTTEPGTPGNEQLRRAHLNTYYPCKVCESALFFRWHEGHFNPEHDRSSCPDCARVGGGRRRGGAVKAKARSEPPMGEPPPDADEPRYAPTVEEIAHQAALIEGERKDLQ